MGFINSENLQSVIWCITIYAFVVSFVYNNRAKKQGFSTLQFMRKFGDPFMWVLYVWERMFNIYCIAFILYSLPAWVKSFWHWVF